MALIDRAFVYIFYIVVGSILGCFQKIVKDSLSLVFGLVLYLASYLEDELIR